MSSEKSFAVHLHAELGPCFNFLGKDSKHTERVTVVIYPTIMGNNVVWRCSKHCGNEECRFTQNDLKKEDQDTPVQPLVDS